MQTTTWYLVISRSAVPDGERRRHHQAHLTWLEEGHADGTILFSGPTTDRQLGIYVMQADNLGTARRRASQDPYHREGVRTFDVFEWDVQRTTSDHRPGSRDAAAQRGE